MKKLIISILLGALFIPAMAQKEVQKEQQKEQQKEKKEKSYAEIKFEKTNHNFGTFAADTAVLDCEFKFTNIGNADLYIHQAFASCGCTVPDFPLEPIKPGKSGVIKVTYDGTHKSPGNMRRSITIQTNSKEEIIKLYITGKMLERKIKETPIIKVEEEE